MIDLTNTFGTAFVSPAVVAVAKEAVLHCSACYAWCFARLAGHSGADVAGVWAHCCGLLDAGSALHGDGSDDDDSISVLVLVVGFEGRE